MLFNSIDFGIFLPIVFIIYWFIVNRNLKLQNLFVVIASYVFYGWWDWRFLFLIFFSTLVDYIVGIGLSKQKNQTKRKWLLLCSIVINLGFLAFFKYYNFFVDNFVAAFSFFGTDIKAHTLNIILPVGISFYTFQTLSYSIDIYRRKLEPTTDFIAFSAFVSFFPQLVAGPIERATNLLPQFYRKRFFDYPKAVDGMKQMLWGLFKKIVIADNCAELADFAFNNTQGSYGSTLMLGAFFFAFQIYGDFSGYSDIAIGCARLFGFELKRNFAYPYFARDIAEFWRRWHISLTTWFRDYLYIPLGGSKGTRWQTIRNTFIIFLVSGFWHGANWTFLVWGALNALFFIPLLLTNKNRRYLDNPAAGRKLPTRREAVSMLFTFCLSTFAWIFFRATSVEHAYTYIAGIFSKTLFSIQPLPVMKHAFVTFILLVFFVITEWCGREQQYAIAQFGKSWQRPYRWLAYCFIIFLIGMFMQSHVTPFIYFQF